MESAGGGREEIAGEASSPERVKYDIGHLSGKLVRFIVPFPPAALNDLLGRLIAAKLSETWERQVVVDNRAGGNTIIGTEFRAKWRAGARWSRKPGARENDCGIQNALQQCNETRVKPT